MEEATMNIKNTAQPIVHGEWNELLHDTRFIHQMENQVLPLYFKRMRWFGGKARILTGIKIYQDIPVSTTSGIAHYLLIKVRYPDGPTEIYALPIVFVSEQFFSGESFPAEAIIARLENESISGYIIDGIYDDAFRSALFLMMSENQKVTGAHYPMSARKGKFLEAQDALQIESRVLKAEQSNSAIIYNNKYFLKLFRKVEYGVNPDFEIINYLTEKGDFCNIPAFVGSIELQHPEKPAMLLLMLQQLVPNEGDAWTYFWLEMEKFYRNVIDSGFHLKPLPIKPHVLSLNWENTPSGLRDLITEEVCERAVMLGRRTAEMHIALANTKDDKSFIPENTDSEFQEKLLKNLLRLVDTKFDLLQRNIQRIPEGLREDAQEMLEGRERVKAFFKIVLQRKMDGKRTRIHGDYHLGQVLVTGNDYFILDFEGEPYKLHDERRDKYPPLKDVAGMMRSFRYAAYATLFQKYESAPELKDKLMQVADVWYHYVSRYFLGEYISTMQGKELLPADDKINDILQVYSFKKAIYELGYEINNRPDWAAIPLQSLVKFVKHYLDA